MDVVAGRLTTVIGTACAASLLCGVLIGYLLIPDNNAAADSASAAPTTPTTTLSNPSATAAASTTPAPTPATPASGTEDKSEIAGLPIRTNEFGIPIQYPRTEQGAISACANYVSAYSDERNREPTRTKEIFRSIATNDPTADRISTRLIDARNKTAKNFGVTSINSPNFRLSYRILGYKVSEYKLDGARIYIWLNASAGTSDGGPDNKPQNFWGTDLCSLSWNGSDWKLSDASDGPNGPDPAEQRSEEFRSFLLIGAGA